MIISSVNTYVLKIPNEINVLVVLYLRPWSMFDGNAPLKVYFKEIIIIFHARPEAIKCFKIFFFPFKAAS